MKWFEDSASKAAQDLIDLRDAKDQLNSAEGNLEKLINRIKEKYDLYSGDFYDLKKDLSIRIADLYADELKGNK